MAAVWLTFRVFSYRHNMTVISRRVRNPYTVTPPLVDWNTFFQANNCVFARRQKNYLCDANFQPRGVHIFILMLAAAASKLSVKYRMASILFDADCLSFRLFFI